MDRLTVREWSGGYVPETNSFDVWDRLAAYEDTGLTPDEVVTLKAENARLRAELEAAEVDMCEMASPDASPCDYCGKKTSCAHIVSCPRRGYGEFMWRGVTENGGANE